MFIKIKDGSKVEVDNGSKVIDVAKKISEGLARNAVAGKVNGKMCQLSSIVKANDLVEIVTLKDEEGMEVLRHSTAHVLALAVKRKFPGTKISIGPAIENGFYYDFDFLEPIGMDDLPSIEAEMEKIIKDKIPFVREEISRADAVKLFKKLDEPYKLKILEEIPEDETLTIYKLGELVDLCRGPHLEDISLIKAFKLQSVTGAYFQGNEKNKMLTRIYGTSFPKKSELDEYLAKLEEAKKRDHRRIGRDLELFFLDETAPGMPYFLPKGWTMINVMLDDWRKVHKAHGYQEFSGPMLNDSTLWKISGHWDHYKDDMFVFTDIDGHEQGLKPMSCPNSIKVFGSKTRSYRDLPLRFNDVDVIHRNEKSGELNGLFRVRMFRQDDSHNYITEEQISSEIKDILSIADDFYKSFKLPYELTLSTRPESFIGDKATWDKAEDDLRAILDELCGKGNYKINEGDGAFYGPKIDIKMQDCMGRKWQLGTVQLDFQLPSRFGVTYIDKDGEKKTPVLVHRALFGSFERFLGVITEHFAGAFPLWIAPVQVKVITISEKQNDYAKKIFDKLNDLDIRVEFDERNEKVGYKIREAQMQKIPYMLVLGDDEMNENKVAVRHRKDGDLGKMSLDEFINLLQKEVETKEIR